MATEVPLATITDG